MRIPDRAPRKTPAILKCSRYAAIIMLVLAAGCQMTADKSAIPVATTATTAEAKAGRHVVFGKATVLSSKAPDRWTETSCAEDLYWTCPDSFRLILVKEGKSSPIRYRLTGDGSFAWNLSPGRYYVAEWEWQMKGEPQTSSISGRIGGSFEVSADDPAIYIGDIVIAFSGSRYGVGIEDRYSASESAYRARFGDTGTASKSLVKIVRLAGDTSGGVSNICAKKWGVNCTKDRLGVDPASPPQHDDEFPRVDSLTPTLVWRPSTKRAVTYDVAIYEAVPYGDWPRTRYLQGELIDSAFGLATPSYAVSKPLAPDRKYFMDRAPARWKCRFDMVDRGLPQGGLFHCGDRLERHVGKSVSARYTLGKALHEAAARAGAACTVASQTLLLGRV